MPQRELLICEAARKKSAGLFNTLYAKKESKTDDNPKLTIELPARERSIGRAKPRKIVKAPMMRNWSVPLLSAHLIKHYGYTLTQIVKALEINLQRSICKDYE